MKKNHNYIAIPPGATIKEQIGMLGMNQKELAARMGMSEKHISKLINGEVQLTVDVAIRLEMILGLPAQFWCNLESIYREKLLRIEEEEAMEVDVEIARKVPYADMVLHGWVVEASKWTEKVLHLRRYFEVAQLDFLRSPLIPEIACRKVEQIEFNNYKLLVWAQKAKVEARDIVTKQVNIEKLKRSLARLKEVVLTQNDGAKVSATGLLADCGIAVVLLPPMNDVHLYGATFYDGNKIVMGVVENPENEWDFWYNLFHELAHVLHGDVGKKGGTNEEDEARADQFAKNMMLELSSEHGSESE
ncbi:MAG: addiction module antidote protein, HigA family [Lachnoclostridium sp.]|nr:addiction module antidote protein, HigA family [Lachnoclostridium sp.]